MGESRFLEMRAVNVARGERVVLHDVNLTVEAGEHVAILGPNGCGKSTLILAMTCQIYPIVRGNAGAHLRARAVGPDGAAQALWRCGGLE
jgi:iron complex transport system ATP-binding protein